MFMSDEKDPVKKVKAKKPAIKKASTAKAKPKTATKQAKKPIKKTTAKPIIKKKTSARNTSKDIIVPTITEEPVTEKAQLHAHTDIDMGAWVMTRVPEDWENYALLMRLDRPIGIWLLLLPALWGIVIGMGGIGGIINHVEAPFIVVAFIIGAILMRGAGCIINDLWDIEIDREVERTKDRPLASGTITPQQAMIFLGFIIAISALILFTMGWVTIAIGILALALAAIYPAMKRMTFWPQAFLGITFNLGVLMGCAAITGGLSAAAFLAYLAAISWTIVYDTIYACQDMEDDDRIGLKSTAILFGENLHLCVNGFMIVSLCFLVLAGIGANAYGTYYAVLALPMLHAFLALRQWDSKDAKSSLEIFKAQRDFGVLVLLALLFI